MLARKYENYAWNEQQEDEGILQTAHREIYESDPHKLLRRQLGIVLAIILTTYFISVVRSEVQVQYGKQLLTMQQQEQELISKNNELKIEVEQLKGPDRIIGLAEQYLGMSVARNNIYLKVASK